MLQKILSRWFSQTEPPLSEFEQLKISAEAGDAEAQYNLGACYDHWYGIDPNPKEAVKWYRKSAEQGNAEAQACPA